MCRKCSLHKTVLWMDKIDLTCEKGQDYFSPSVEMHFGNGKRILTAGFRPRPSEIL